MNRPPAIEARVNLKAGLTGAVFVLAVLVLLGLAGCSSAPATDAQGRYVVHLTADNMFSPKAMTIPLNSTVVWIVQGGEHDVSGNGPGGPFGTYIDGPPGGHLTTGMEYQHRFTQKGTYEVLCYIHHGMGMTGTITVE